MHAEAMGRQGSQRGSLTGSHHEGLVAWARRQCRDQSIDTVIQGSEGECRRRGRGGPRRPAHERHGRLRQVGGDAAGALLGSNPSPVQVKRGMHDNLGLGIRALRQRIRQTQAPEGRGSEGSRLGQVRRQVWSEPRDWKECSRRGCLGHATRAEGPGDVAAHGAASTGRPDRGEHARHTVQRICFCGLGKARLGSKAVLWMHCTRVTKAW
mmetsp:Transcript_23620/g.69109  ORF Transcript_23620/g.69109 Transcript_23620/m.69109 type:complete len:210 (-) Transcript_23620:214-843(-)